MGWLDGVGSNDFVTHGDVHLDYRFIGMTN